MEIISAPEGLKESKAGYVSGVSIAALTIAWHLVLSSCHIQYDINLLHAHSTLEYIVDDCEYRY